MMAAIKKQAENILALIYRTMNISAKQGLKVGLGCLMMVTLLGSSMILQTSYAQTLGNLSLNLARHPLKGSQPDHYAILIRPETQSKGQVETVDTPPRTVSVAGTGQASAQPDQAIVHLGVQTEAETAEQALAENNDQMQGLLTTLANGGIPDEDIQTQTLQLYPRYENPDEPQQTPQVAGYVALNTVEVTVKDLEQLGPLLDAAVQAGSNTIQGIQFEISNPTEVMDQARQAAIEDATHKAEQLTMLMESELGEVLTISETSYLPIPVTQQSMTAEKAAAVPIQPGSQSLQVDVQVTWLLQ